MASVADGDRRAVGEGDGEGLVRRGDAGRHGHRSADGARGRSGHRDGDPGGWLPLLATATPVATPWPLYAVGMPVVGVHCRAWTLPVVAAGPAHSRFMLQGLLVKVELSVASGEPQATAVLSDAAGSGVSPGLRSAHGPAVPPAMTVELAGEMAREGLFPPPPLLFPDPPPQATARQSNGTDVSQLATDMWEPFVRFSTFRRRPPGAPTAGRPSERFRALGHERPRPVGEGILRVRSMSASHRRRRLGTSPPASAPSSRIQRGVPHLNPAYRRR